MTSRSSSAGRAHEDREALAVHLERHRVFGKGEVTGPTAEFTSASRLGAMRRRLGRDLTLAEKFTLAAKPLTVFSVCPTARVWRSLGHSACA
jgi:hypothetical protein